MENKRLKIGIVGLGNRGYQLIPAICNMKNVKVTAICDVYLERIVKATQLIEKITDSKPFASENYNDILNHNDVDAIIITTSWENHIEIATKSMRIGKITGLDVGGAYSINDCWELVREYERTKTPFMFLENCCFDRDELMVTAMVRDGLFGDIVHCSGSYTHDLREEVITGIEKKHYRYRNYLKRCCDNYPTHELGPISKILNINRGNRMLSLVSVASNSLGLSEYASSNHQNNCRKFKQGDVVNTIIKCYNGETIYIKLSTTTASFYDRELSVTGTKGKYSQTTNSVFIDGVHTETADDYPLYVKKIFNNAVQYEKKYLPKIWQNITEKDLKGGHGGMDALMLKEFVGCALSGDKMLIDVYDAATWMSISCLSEQSIHLGGVPQIIPDFTNGKWLLRKGEDVVKLK